MAAGIEAQVGECASERGRPSSIGTANRHWTRRALAEADARADGADPACGPERGHARELFERLAVLPEGDAERLRIRGELVELHLPLVEYLARRFRNRGRMARRPYPGGDDRADQVH